MKPLSGPMTPNVFAVPEPLLKRIPARKLISQGFYGVEIVDNGRLNLLRGIPTGVNRVEYQTIKLNFQSLVWILSIDPDTLSGVPCSKRPIVQDHGRNVLRYGDVSFEFRL